MNDTDTTECYAYVKINSFNIIFPDNIEFKDDFFCIKWLLSIKIEGKWWHKLLAILSFVIPAIILYIVDFVIWLLKLCVGKVIEWVSSFANKFAGWLAISVIIILMIWLAYSGAYATLFTWLSQLLF